jgi:stage V sporulation protein S
METLRVSGRTNVKKLGAAIYHALKGNGGQVEVQAVGASAVNQAVKGIAAARGMAAPEGGDLKAVPAFADAEIENEPRTAVKFIVHWR